MLGLNISCSSMPVLALIWPVRIHKLHIGWVGFLGDVMGGRICSIDFLCYYLKLTFIPFLCSFYLQKLILWVAVLPLNVVLIGYGVES